MSDEVLTRRQIRELERAGLAVPRPEARPEQTATSALNLPPEMLNPVLALKAEPSSGLPTRRELREQEIAAQKNDSTENQVVEPEAISIEVAAPDPLPEIIDDSLFEISPNLSVESASASIVIDEIRDVTNSVHLLDSGEILHTGSITLPVLSTNTGEMALVSEAQTADQAATTDAAIGYVSSINPVRASEVGNFGAELDIVPPKFKPGESQLYLALTISISIVAIGALILGSYMLKIFN